RFGLVGDGMGHDDRTGFFFWGMVHGSEPVDPLRRIGEATDQVSVLSGLGHCRPKANPANPATKMLLRLTVQRNEPVR
ncbi:hypothetical protein PIB30_053247, partial [Stylosanthes scabra]|nr:hypothetical protein [Stylosanthes scabra]